MEDHNILVFVCALISGLHTGFANGPYNGGDWVSASAQGNRAPSNLSSFLQCQKNPPHSMVPSTILFRLPGSTLTSNKFEYECREGYPDRVYLECINGKWRWTNGTCKLRLCTPPPRVNDTTWTIGVQRISRRRDWQALGQHMNDRTEGVKLVYECVKDTEMRLFGPRTVTCNGIKNSHRAEWSDTPFCKPNRECVLTEKSVLHASVSCISRYCAAFYNSSQVRIECEEGYVLRGSSLLTCVVPSVDPNRDTYWSPRLPRCVKMDDSISGSDSESSLFPGANLPVSVVIIVVASCLTTLITVTVVVLLCRRCSARSRPAPLPAHGAYTSSDCVALIMPPPSYEEALAAGALGPASGNAHGADARLSAHMRAQHASGQQLRHGHGPGFLPGYTRSPRDYRPLNNPGAETTGGSFGGRRGQRQSQRSANSATGTGSVGPDPDAVSRHSTITSGSHGAPLTNLSGSLETMTVSDGTSVTLRTYESACGSNPSLGSTRPQTGSLHGHEDTTSTCSSAAPAAVSTSPKPPPESAPSTGEPRCDRSD